MPYTRVNRIRCSSAENGDRACAADAARSPHKPDSRAQAYAATKPDSRAQAYAATHKLCSLAGCTGLTAGSRPCCPTKPPSRQLRLDTVLRFSTFSRTCSQPALPRSCEPARARRRHEQSNYPKYLITLSTQSTLIRAP